MSACVQPDQRSATARIEEIRLRRKRGVVAIVYCTYGDESRDQTKKLVYAVGGLFGHQEQWDNLELAWNERTGGRIFHASDCDSDQGEFRDSSHDENKKLYSDLTQLLARSNIVGHGIAINLPDYRQSFPSDLEHAPYLWGFGEILQISSELAYLSLPSEPVEVIFDRNEEVQFSAAELYAAALDLKRIPTRANLCEKVSFACRRTVGIQAADLFAREAMKHLENNIGPVRRPSRTSFSVLRDTHRFTVVTLDKIDFERAKANYNPKLRQRATMESYRQWLASKGLQDNLVNRVKHLQEFPELREN